MGLAAVICCHFWNVITLGCMIKQMEVSAMVDMVAGWLLEYLQANMGGNGVSTRKTNLLSEQVVMHAL